VIQVNGGKVPTAALLQFLREAIFGHFQTLDFMKVHQIVSQEI
jgi:hypothetical protein